MYYSIRGKVIHLHWVDISKQFLCVRIYGIFFNNFLHFTSYLFFCCVQILFVFRCCCCGYKEYVCCEHLLLSLHICYLFSSSLALKHIWHIIFFWCRSFIYMCSHTISIRLPTKRNSNGVNNISQRKTTPTAIAMGTQALTNNCYIKNVIINVGE